MLDRKVRDRVNVAIDPILFDAFAAKYHIKSAPKPRMRRYWRRKVRDWAEEETLKCTKLNHQTVGPKAKRNGGAGRKQIIDEDVEYKMYKQLHEECMNGRSFTFDGLVEFFSFYLRESGLYRIDGEPPNPETEHLKKISINERFITNFKKRWNIVRRTQGTKTMYDINNVLAEHAIVCAKVFALRLLLGSYITYTGHHDQICLFYAHCTDITYTTSTTRGVNGQKKIQNKNKTLTGIPLIMHSLLDDKISFGPTVLIFESAAKDNGFGATFVKDLKKRGLNAGFDADKVLFIDTSYNGWQLNDNMLASIQALKQNKRGMIGFDNWSLFKLPEFVDALLSHDIYPFYNVPGASGLCGLLDLDTNSDVHKIYRQERKKIERKLPHLTKTSTGKDKALRRDYLALAMYRTMKKIKEDKQKHVVYKKYSQKLGYNANIDEDQDGADCFMDHTMRHLHDDATQQHKKLDQLTINPITSDVETVTKTKRKPGRTVTDIGKLQIVIVNRN